MSKPKFPSIGIAESLEKAAKLEPAKEMFQKALATAKKPDGEKIVNLFKKYEWQSCLDNLHNMEPVLYRLLGS